MTNSDLGGKKNNEQAGLFNNDFRVVLDYLLYKHQVHQVHILYDFVFAEVAVMPKTHFKLWLQS